MYAYVLEHIGFLNKIIIIIIIIIIKRKIKHLNIYIDCLR